MFHGSRQLPRPRGEHDISVHRRASRKPASAGGPLRRCVAALAVGAMLAGSTSCGLLDDDTSTPSGEADDTSTRSGEATASWDVDGDGADDALTWTDNGKPAIVYGADTSGSGKPIPGAPTMASAGQRPTTADFDADGHDDIAFCQGQEEPLGGLLRKEKSGSLVIAFGSDDGMTKPVDMGPFPHVKVGGRYPYRPACPELAAADVDGDGAHDLIAGGRQFLAWAKGGENARSAESWSFERIATKKDRDDYRYDFREVQLGDINGDDRPDLAAMEHEVLGSNEATAQRTRVWLGTSDGFEQHSGGRSDYDALLRLGDVNGDGYDDLVTFTTMDAGKTLVWHGSDEGIDTSTAPDTRLSRHSLGLGAMPQRYLGLRSYHMELTDISGDGIDDLAFLVDKDDEKTGRAHALVVPGTERGLAPRRLSEIRGKTVDAVESTGLYPDASAPYSWGGVHLGDLTGDGGNDLTLTLPRAEADGGGSEGDRHTWTTHVLRSESLHRIDTRTAPQDRPEPDTAAAEAWDVNGDGVAELVVGATDQSEDTGMGGPHGALAVLRGIEGEMPRPWQQVDEHDPTGLPKQLFDAFPYALSSGDYNSDGYADVAACGAGKVLVLAGSTDGLGHGFVIDDRRTGSCRSLDTADVNSDGYADILVTNREKKLLVGFGGPEATEPASWRLRTVTTNPASDAVLGDWNGDGHPDVAYGTHPSGKTRFLLGGSDGLEPAGDPLPGVPMAAGDLNDDGYDDLATTTETDIETSDAAGTGLELSYGSEDGLVREGAPETITAETAGLRPNAAGHTGFADSVSIGDMDGDDHPELAVGAPSTAARGVQGAGAVAVFPGSADGPVLSKPEVLDQDSPGYPGKAQEDDQFGSMIEHLDVNGDGTYELLATSRWEDDQRGAVHVIGQDEVVRLYPGDVGIDEDTEGFGLHRSSALTVVPFF